MVIKLVGNGTVPKQDLGTKVTRLIELSQDGFLVPAGFAVTPDIYQRFLNPILDKVKHLLTNSQKPDKEITKLFLESELQLEDKKRLEEAKGNILFDNLLAIRSSGNVYVNGQVFREDSKDISLAGQFDSFLAVPIYGIENAIKMCWASLYNQRSIQRFEATGNKDYAKSGMSVLCHEMIPATKSAVVMTKDPISGENVLGIESTYGPCEAIVSGRVTGDYFKVDKESGKVIDSEKGEKEETAVYSVFDGTNNRNIWWNTNNNALRENWSLNQSEIEKICEIAIAVENKYRHPQDMEFVFQNDQLYIVQTRNITTI